ncbi:uncharacterized protein LOC108680463 [Hyalella azteca]|uniref:Uncharacterized protein LOC108680463 n=1 Tax=Hyalella azteca TaxID=294128 RepID=A0A8B7PGT2_HYAAZ|nr:uncharacterized protein LOC108680463 [Hyalella azteca]
MPLNFKRPVAPSQLPLPAETKFKPKHPTRIYDYNYKVGESYYNPQTDYIGSRPLSNTSSSYVKPPEAQTYAERFAQRPIYGSARGLPYGESESVYNQPLASRLTGTGGPGSSLPKEPGRRGRASSLSRDPGAETPSYGSRFHRRSSLFDEDDFPSWQQSKKFSLGSSDPDRVRDYAVQGRMKRAIDDFLKTPRTTPTREYETSEVKFRQETGPKGQQIIKREQYTYTLPENSQTLRKSSITETSDFASKPPLNLRTRRSSIGAGEEFSSRASVRTRKYSEDTSSRLPPRPSRYGRGSDDSPTYSNAQQVRDARRAKESDELTESIMKMVNKMKSHHLDDATADIRSISRTVRATSLDPFEDDSDRSRSKQRARLHKFTYGIGKV